MVANEGNVGLAFGLVIAAGLSTTIGATFSFCSNLYNRRLLAGALAISAGVMIYVSFAEIFCVKAVEGFLDAGYDDSAAWRYATFSFFAGIISIAILDWLVHRVTRMAYAGADAKLEGAVPTTACGACNAHGPAGGTTRSAALVESAELTLQPPVQAQLEQLHPAPQPATAAAQPLDVSVALVNQLQTDVEKLGAARQAASGGEAAEAGEGTSASEEGASASEEGAPGQGDKAGKDDDAAAREERRALTKMSLLTGLAIAIHNFPEGLATFVATLADSSVGISVAIAIALHNIPEGICVAMPVYYATGSRWKGFLWAFLSGVSEPIGALIGWAILADGFSDTAFGVIFGMVGGMMVFIALRELLPTAHKYDPEDSVVSICLVIGMALMAASLLLFAI